MPDMRYDAAGLRAAASGHLGAAGAVEQMVTALAQTAITSAMFGGVDAAARLAAAVELARQVQAWSAAGEATARNGLGNRVQATGRPRRRAHRPHHLDRRGRSRLDRRGPGGMNAGASGSVLPRRRLPFPSTRAAAGAEGLW